MTPESKKSLMRNLGEFLGHITRAIRTDPAKNKPTIVRKDVEEEQRGNITLRRTTIEEVEIAKPTTEGRSPTETDN